jgi:hypothetical protein
MADSKIGCESEVLNRAGNREFILRDECWHCARLKMDLKRATLELESATEIIRILREEMISAVLEVRNSTNDGHNEGNENDSPQEGNKQIPEQESQQNETMENSKDKCNNKNVICASSGKDNELQSELKEVIKVSDPQDEQFPTLSSSRNSDIVPPLKTIKTIVKHIPVIVNSQVITNNCDNTTPTNDNRTAKGQNNVIKHKIMVIGDSHCRGTARNISDYLGGKFEVTGMTKLGAGAVDIFTPTNLNYRHLTKKDVIVVQGGSNDVYRNNSKSALTQFVKFCEDLNTVNIIILDIPHRYDLIETSCVNREIQAFNRKLRKVTSLYKHVTILEVNNNREYLVL